MNQKLKRILALIALALIVFFILFTAILSLTGSRDFWGFFSLILTAPILIAGIAMILRFFR